VTHTTPTDRSNTTDTKTPSSNNLGLIIGLSVGLGGLIILVVVIVVIILVVAYYRRRNKIGRISYYSNGSGLIDFDYTIPAAAIADNNANLGHGNAGELEPDDKKY